MRALPRLAIWALKLIPLGDRRTDVHADIADLYSDRRERYGVLYAQRRLAADLASVARTNSRGGSVFQDLRFGLRLIRRHPAPIAIVIGGLAIAIGMVTSMFSIINVTMLRPYKMDDPSSVVAISRIDHHWSIWPYADFVQMRERAKLTTLEAIDTGSVRFGATADQDSADALRIQFVSGGYMQTLGGRAIMGRSLGTSDDTPSAPGAVAVSHYFWTAHLNSDPTAIGRPIWLNGVPMTVVGVIGKDFVGPVHEPMPFWATFASYDDLFGGQQFTPATRTIVEVFGRLQPGVATSAAEDELVALARALPNAKPAEKSGALRPVELLSARTPSSGKDATENYAAIAAILGVVGLVLVLACANAANLLLAGAVTRAREIGVRLALGATRRRLVRQLLSEGLLLGLFAGGFGLLFSIWFVPLLASLLRLPAGLDVGLDGRVLTFVTFVAVLCGLGASLAPARYGVRGQLLSSLNSQRSRADGGRRSSRLRTSLIAFQAAVSVLMLVAASLLTRTTLVMTSRGPGFDVDKLLSVSAEMPKGVDERAYFLSALDAVRAVPSVESVALSQYQPFGGSRETYRIAGMDYGDYGIVVTSSDADYFRTAGLRVVRGRAFTADEVSAEAPVALISEGVARNFFGGQDPIGRLVNEIPSPDKNTGSARIIGVVGDVVMTSIHSADYGMIYRPISAKRSNPPVLMIRTERPGAVARAVETAMLRIDPRVRLTSAAVARNAGAFFELTRMQAILAITIASLAFALAVLGVYGVTAFVASQRTQEVGVRMAIGASASDIVSMLVRDSLRPVLIGLAIGLVAALLAGPVIANFLAGVGPRDPTAIIVSVAALIGGALIAILAPARRAAAANPASVLRD